MNCRICGKKLTTSQEEQELCDECLYSEIYRGNVSKEKKTKKCSKCSRNLPLSEFYKDTDKWGGFKTICKDCYSRYYPKAKSKKLREEEIERIQEIEYHWRKSKNWIPIRGRYYKYREYKNQPENEASIIKIKSTKCGKWPFLIIDFEPIKSKNPDVAEMVIAFCEVWHIWKFQEISEHEALKENND